MSTPHQRKLARRGFCLCCMATATLATAGGWLTPSQAFAEARNIVDLIRDGAAMKPIKIHRLSGNISVLEGSGGNIAGLTGSDGKVFIDAGITASRTRILEAANGLSRDPITHLINTHWHFDHADGNQWLSAEGAAIIAHEKTQKPKATPPQCSLARRNRYRPRKGYKPDRRSVPYRIPKGGNPISQRLHGLPPVAKIWRQRDRVAH